MFLSIIGNAQCTHCWIKTYNGISDTIVRSSNCIELNESCNYNVDFNKIIPRIRQTKFEEVQRTELVHYLDSLKSLPDDSIHNFEIRLIERDLNSQFQIVKYDSFELALYAMDTINLEAKNYVIYAFSSNFTTEWNEDYNNWFFYYTPEFGIVEAEYICIWNSEFPCQVIMSLQDNCRINNSNKDHFIRTKDYILRTRFRH